MNRTPYYSDESLELWHGDSLEVLRDLPDQSVDCCVTSPPYFGLRDYGEDGQYGLEASPAEYVETMRALFAEVRRVLADDGTLWLNLGDSYVGGGGYSPDSPSNQAGSKASTSKGLIGGGITTSRSGLSAKNLMGIPWRVAFALQGDGWILRNDIIWAKPNGMPESVTDRLSTKHEHVFMFSKSPRYWFDLDVVREPHAEVSLKRAQPHRADPGRSSREGLTHAGVAGPQTLHLEQMNHAAGRNPGDVWSIPTQPFSEAHFAVMPQDLASRCIAAGCKTSRCRECGHVPTQIKTRDGMDLSRPQAQRAQDIAAANGLTSEHFAAIRSVGVSDTGKAAVTQSGTGKNTAEVQALADHAKSVLKGYTREFLLDREVTSGWTDCGHGQMSPGVVLDPFSGSGTTGLAAAKHGRKYVGIDLSSDYLDLSLRTRLAQSAIDFGQVS